MDEQVFDRLTRVLSGSSRRKMLASVGMALVGALAGPVLRDDALAKGKGKPGQRKAKGKGKSHTGQHQAQHNHHGHEQHQAAKAKAKSRRRGQNGADANWGPCGNGGKKDNACRHDTQCCTGYCSQKHGACRCKTMGEGCTEDRSCCTRLGQPMTCQREASRLPGTVSQGGEILH
jgi:hypothetical protein